MTPTNHNAFAITPPGAEPRAVEVVGMLGDSVVEVAHLEPARHRPGKSPRRAAWFTIGAGGLLLTVAAVAFTIGVRTSADNQHAKRQWTEFEQRPAHSFRPVRLGPGYDWMALGGLLGGLAAIVWGVARLRASEPRTRFTIGDGQDADMNIEGASAVGFPLVEHRGDAAIVTFTDGMTGAVHQGGASYALSELTATGVATPSPAHPFARELRLAPDSTVRLSIGPTSFAIRDVPAQRTTIAAALLAFESRAAKFVAGSALVHLVLLGLMSTIPADPRSLVLPFGSGEERLVRVESVPTELPIAEVLPGASGHSAGEQGSEAAMGDTGEAGDPRSNANGKLTIRDRGGEERLSRADAMAMARSAGFLGDLKALDTFATQIGFDGESSGRDLIDNYGRIDGEGYGPGGGRFGMGMTGFGPGGGGIKVGGYGTICGDKAKSCSPDGRGFGEVGRPDRLRGRRPSGPTVDIKPPILKGDLDREIIRRYVRRKAARLQYCYERELQATSDLEGTVTADFVISGQGKVISVDASGMGHDGIESCVAGVIRAIEFPKPSGEGLVQVKYPFTFRRAGQ